MGPGYSQRRRQGGAVGGGRRRLHHFQHDRAAKLDAVFLSPAAVSRRLTVATTGVTRMPTACTPAAPTSCSPMAACTSSSRRSPSRPTGRWGRRPMARSSRRTLLTGHERPRGTSKLVAASSRQGSASWGARLRNHCPACFLTLVPLLPDLAAGGVEAESGSGIRRRPSSGSWVCR